MAPKNKNTKKDVWEDYDVTEYVQEHINDPSKNNGFILFHKWDDFGVVYPSSEYEKDKSKRPKLYIKCDNINVGINDKNKIGNSPDLHIHISNNSISFTIPYNKSNVSINNAKGQNLLTFEANRKNYKIFFHILSTGLHFLTIKHSNRIQIRKFIITK